MFLEKSVGFINPTNVSHLASELGLDDKGDSLMSGLIGRYKPEQYASRLRKEQASKWAYKHVAQGKDTILEKIFGNWAKKYFEFSDL